MNLLILGTGSAFPCPHRSTTSAILRHLKDGSQWLFDCGEGTQIQVQRFKEVKIKQINKIFITHLHGDHMFGLPGFLATLSTNDVRSVIIEIYGPLGLKKFIRTALGLGNNDLNYRLRINEISVDEKCCPPNWQCFVSTECWDQILPYEDEGRIVQPTYDSLGEPAWKLFYDINSKTTVWAVPLQHTIPSLGYVVLSDDKLGSLDMEKVKSMGVPIGPLLKDLKNGFDVQLSNGTVIKHTDVVGPPTAGVNVAILGDTCDSSSLVRFMKREFISPSRKSVQLNYLVHETTLGNELEDKCIQRGHSTPRMAACIANALCVDNIIITHFSQRYSDDQCDKSSVEMLKNEVIQSGFKGHVILAKDLISIDLK